MNKKFLLILLYAMPFMLLVLFCTNPQNPFTNTDNAKITLAFRDSKGVLASGNIVYDTVGNTFRIGVCPSVSNLIDSILFTIIKYKNNNDSTIVIKNDYLDTLWYAFTFASAGRWVINVQADIQGGKVSSQSGEIRIAGKIVKASIKPTIITQSTDSIANFYVTAEGDGPFKYQWNHGSSSLTGKTELGLLLNHIAFADSGIYNCFVTDKWGDTVTSSNCTLSVKPLNIFSAVISPANTTKPLDSSIVFTVTAVGDTPFTYKWFHASLEIPGQTNAAFTIAHAAFADSGLYTCVVKNKNNDSITTSAAILHVIAKANGKPVLSLVKGHLKILSSEICSLTVKSTEPDIGQSDTVTVLKGPLNFSFKDSLFTWAVPSGYLGTDTVKMDTVFFRSSDNGIPSLQDTLKVAIEVRKSIALPDSIKNLVGITRNNGIFTFKWNASKNADNYQVYRAKDTTNFVSLGTCIDTFFANAVKDTAFYYYVVASNSKGMSAPSNRILSTSVNTAPKWIRDTIKVSVLENASITINLADSVSDANGDNIVYQMTSGDPLKNSLVFSTWKYTASYTDSGTYPIKIQASDGIAAPSAITILLHVVNVPRPPQPQPQSVSTKRNTALQITLSAISPDSTAITSWVIDTAATHGTAALANSSQPTVTYTPTPGFIGTDYFTFKASAGSLQSVSSAKVSIKIDTNNIAPVISQKLAAKTLTSGDSLVLSVTVNSDVFPAPLYSWYKGGAFLDSTRVGTWKKLNMQGSDSGFYYVIASNLAGRDSSGASVTVNVPPTVTTQPQAKRILEHQTIALNVVAIGTLPLTYQWRKNGTNIPSNSSAQNYSLSNVTPTDSGDYTVIVTNVVRSCTSAVAHVTVLPTYSLATSSLPTVGGTISRSNDTIAYAMGDSVTLTATAATGYRFTGWTGDASGTTNPLKVIFTGSKNVTAKFIKQYSLTITVPQGGTLTKTPNQTTYDSNSTVILTVTAALTYNFFGWTGDTTAQSNSISLVMNANKNLLANIIPHYNWVPANSGLTDTIVKSFAFNGNVIYAGSADSGVYRTINGGTSWNKMDTGLTGLCVYSLACMGSIVIAGTDAGAFLSKDSAKTWQVSTTWNGGSCYALGVKGTGIYGGALGAIYFSPDSGKTWTQLTLSIAGQIYSIAINGSTILAGDRGNIKQSQDDGSTWYNRVTLSYFTPYSFNFNGTNIFAGTPTYGIYRSPDAGTTWTRIDTTIATRALTSYGSTIFAGGQKFDDPNGFSDIFVSIDNGEHWYPQGFSGTSGKNALILIGKTIFLGLNGSGGIYKASIP